MTMDEMNKINENIIKDMYVNDNWQSNYINNNMAPRFSDSYFDN